jgi:hypothetical protein
MAHGSMKGGAMQTPNQEAYENESCGSSDIFEEIHCDGMPRQCARCGGRPAIIVRLRHPGTHWRH